MCGLVSYCGNKPGNIELVKTLLLYNTARGTHATGICINNSIIKDTEQAFKFIAQNVKAFRYTQQRQFTILGHDRQASVGARENKELAHPFTFKREKHKSSIIGMHNGTINNIIDLCEKYNIKRDYSKSDSYHLFQIMATLERNQVLGLLSEIGGFATLIFYSDAELNKLYVLRDPDRELFYWQESPNSIYISSIKDSLLALDANEEDVHEFEGNNFYEIKNGEIVSKKPIERKPFKSYVAPVRNTSKSSSSTTAWPHSGGGRSRQSNVPFRQDDVTPQITGLRESPYSAVDDDTDIEKGKKDGILRCIENEYWLNGEIALGVIAYNAKGQTIALTDFHADTKKYTEEGYKKGYFIYGTKCKNLEDYMKLRDLACPNFKEGGDRPSSKRFLAMSNQVKANYSEYPIKNGLIPVFTISESLGADLKRKGFTKHSWRPDLGDITYTIEIFNESSTNGKIAGELKHTPVKAEPATVISKMNFEQEVFHKIITTNQALSGKQLYDRWLHKRVLIDSDTNKKAFMAEFLSFSIVACILDPVAASKLGESETPEVFLESTAGAMSKLYKQAHIIFTSYGDKEPELEVSDDEGAIWHEHPTHPNIFKDLGNGVVEIIPTDEQLEDMEDPDDSAEVVEEDVIDNVTQSSLMADDQISAEVAIIQDQNEIVDEMKFQVLFDNAFEIDRFFDDVIDASDAQENENLLDAMGLCLIHEKTITERQFLEAKESDFDVYYNSILTYYEEYRQNCGASTSKTLPTVRPMITVGQGLLKVYKEIVSLSEKHGNPAISAVRQTNIVLKSAEFSALLKALNPELTESVSKLFGDAGFDFEQIVRDYGNVNS